MNSDRPIQVLSPPAATGKAARFTPEHFNRALCAAGLLLLVVLAALAALAAAKACPGVLATFDQRILVTLTAVFAGALVAGLAGFAFSAIAGAILFHFREPADAVPLLLVMSIATQCFGIARFWRVIRWRHCATYVLGGLAGIPIGALLLARLNASVFVAAFGVFLIVYSTSMVLRPDFAIRRGGRACELAAGFLGGITGGATAFPGAIPTMWCNARGLGKLEQRGIVQPYILTMQIATLVYFSKVGLLTSGLAADAAWCLPATALGTIAGIALFDRIDEAKFKRVTLMFLFVSGVLLAL